MEIICKTIPLKIKIIYEAKKRVLKNPSGGFFTFCGIIVYCFECFRCVLHVLLSIFYVTLLTFGWYFTRLIIMVHHPCTW